MHKKLVSVVIPMYYEEKVAEECCKRLKRVMDSCGYPYELIFVNDGSRDGTQGILEQLAGRDNRVKVIAFSRNFGHQAAVTAGIDKAGGSAIVIIDADLQDPPELIIEMLRLWEQGYEVVYAKRKRRKGESFFKRVSASLFYRVLDMLSDTRIPVDTGDFRLIDAKAADVLRNMREKDRFLRGMVSWVGFRQVPVEYEREERYAGETKYPLKKMIKLALDGIFSFSYKPLKLSQYLGFFAVISVPLIFTRDAIMAAVVFLGGVQLISIGILGEYIGRIHEESKGRPLYIIEKEINIDDEK
ncbi:MAG: glycosyltransferase family 2 protein [Gracilibacteraceae bacterium]|nr:glycosyltransferase family 2 protein [Gracilibacteraceae bacterium]